MQKRRVIGLVVLAGGLVATPAWSDEAPAIRSLREASQQTARVRLDRVSGTLRFVGLRPGSLALAGDTPAERAADFLSRHGSAFGVTEPATQLSAPRVFTDRYATTHVAYDQRFRGLPVFAASLRVHFDAEGRLAAANGNFLPGVDVDPRPSWTAAEAERVAVAHALRGIAGAAPLAPLEARSTGLAVFRSGLVRGVPGRDHLVWQVEVVAGGSVREQRFVDAHTGKIVETIAGIHTVVDRLIRAGQFDGPLLWSEGDALPYDTADPTNDDQVNGLIDYAEDVYDLFLVLSGGSFPSWDGLDSTMQTVWKTTELSCPNASWNGASTNYCDGVASDDIVAHEWAHAYTERTHGLIYQWQSGALNESYSDIFGEIIDAINGDGTDAPAPARTSGDCSTFGGSPPPRLDVLAPGAIAGSYFAGGANFNPSPPVAATALVEEVNDGNGDATDACESLVGFTAGRIALIDRGTCNFASKTKRAQEAGAVAVIVVNSNDNAYQMGGSDGSIVIPAVMVSSSDGQSLRDQLGVGVMATIELGVADAPSVRWLNGEDAAGFGGSIRDLWNPQCFGDPDRVGDGRYACGTGDGGGVHTNSGVPNHGFALVVDGGSFNGQSVAGIGLTKAAHLYWRAMATYQMPATNFADHADALEQSCDDMEGIELAELLTGAPSGESLTTTDCEQLAQAMLAVEMANDPPCDFQPLLDPDAPVLPCAAVAFADDFESDPTAQWSRSNEGVFAEYEPRDWEWTSELPEGGSGAAFFAVDSLQIGNCVEGDDDQSGVMFLESPAIALGGEALLGFEHWVATESGYDGGNLELSVNGGGWQAIVGDDFLFNRYNQTLISEGSGNTNPMAGEEAFSGSDGGEVNGSWGESHVDLGPYADPGDTIRLRFDFGVDGCNGNRGWYLDNVRVCTSESGAGGVPDGAGIPGTPLTLDRAGADVALGWGASCVAADTDYEIYEGPLGDFTAHTARSCSTAGETEALFTPEAGNRYFLVVPRGSDREGSYGTDAQGNQRVQGTGACFAQALAPACD